VLTFVVVDDALTDRTLISGMLSKAFDCQVETAEDGQQALQLLNDHRPDLVLTDMQMPVMNGLELVAAVKDEFPMVPVILMTAQGSEELAAAAMHQGALSYVPKRRLVSDLIETVSRVLDASAEGVIPPHLMHHLDHSESVFTLHNDPHMIAATVSYLQRLLRCLPLGSQTERLRVGLAVDAALSNALFHGNMEISHAEAKDPADRMRILRERIGQEPYRSRRIHLTARINRKRAEFVIRDEGDGFDVSKYSSENAFIGGEHSGGRGLAIMHAVMDTVMFNSSGNEVMLVRNRVIDDR
jgi:CheY-like chemotaxis protein